MVSLEEKLSDLYPNQDSNKIYTSGREGYWSNLSKEENDAFSSALASSGTKAAVRSVIPQFEEMIFSEKREAALELLDHRKPGVCIDYGCMWGVLSVGMAKRGHQVVSIDKTYHSLNFLRYRVDEDKLNNVHIIQDDIKEVEISNLADYAIVNGVLEWIPILEEVDVNNYYSGGQSANTSTHSPKQMQREFLSKVNHSLKDGGKMLLAIENRHFYQYYMGRKDPHANLLFTTFLPRWLSNVVSRLYHRKQYRNYIYSFNEINDLVLNSGFTNCQMYMAFPDYHFPELILPYTSEGASKYDKYSNKNRITWKQKIAYYVEYFLIKFMRAKHFSPAIIIVADK